MIAVIDYDRGNLHSVTSALKRLDIPHIVTDEPDELRQADALILPGVGHFRDAIDSLNQKQLISVIKEEAVKKPFFGICLGMQLLFDSSEEGGYSEGLGLIPGTIRRFAGIDENHEPYKVPHMGWNELVFHQPDHPILKGLKEDYAYFVHSYLAFPEDEATLLAYSNYHGRVPAIVGKGHVIGAQFHPEKSAAFGQALLKNFYEQSVLSIKKL
ncbi:imidazole glycerol phosphate synthase subunit HisH [Pullulanibacillus sp. KACC 23026]|uniref:imidazole glycerol phosphate synthase subunit HisH n=1 Tax=Pullulanibacillus sp. KACC 23026 TaxID=3028315 RepID=UPI0023B0A376|nr:imidazole glycerol phosphate synthase subunit HisH [Pullulanibacillus sp. KACC 23026]WEG13618.1 imidazole glycerol phosphate synthase subunit HisH [Pullulanibacillus sp. KACC 23026]